jgi:hypothetical protein
LVINTTSHPFGTRITLDRDFDVPNNDPKIAEIKDLQQTLEIETVVI